jgi:hypothetical protein
MLIYTVYFTYVNFKFTFFVYCIYSHKNEIEVKSNKIILFFYRCGLAWAHWIRSILMSTNKTVFNIVVVPNLRL